MATRANALVVMAKAPFAGEAKTRLRPAFSAEQAAEISRCLLLDLISHIQDFTRADRFVAFTPAEAAAAMKRILPADFDGFSQRGRDLGERMNHAVCELAYRGYKNVVVIGGDLPALPIRFLDEAFRILCAPEKKVVLGPTKDGGYYLIGLNQIMPQIFEDIAWSTAEVFQATVNKLKLLGIDSACLPTWFDIDTVEDLRYLKSMLEQLPKNSLKHTAKFLNNLMLD
jgi:uncharacterized protein